MTDGLRLLCWPLPWCFRSQPLPFLFPALEESIPPPAFFLERTQVLHLHLDTVSQQPPATPLPVILLAPKGSAGSFSLPVRLLKPLGPEAAILPVDDGLDLESIRVNNDVVLT